MTRPVAALGLVVVAGAAIPPATPFGLVAVLLLYPVTVRGGVRAGLLGTVALAAALVVHDLAWDALRMDEYIVDALRAGASGFLTKDAPAQELVAAVRAVAAGDAVLSPAATRRLLDRVGRRLPPVTPGPPGDAGLTERELDVLRLLAAGMSNAEIADALVVAEPTVKTHVSNLLGKLGLRDRVQAVIHAYESGLVPRSG